MRRRCVDGWFNGRQQTVKLSSLNDGRGRRVQLTFLWNLGLEMRGGERKGRGEKTFEKQSSVVVAEAACPQDKRSNELQGEMLCSFMTGSLTFVVREHTHMTSTMVGGGGPQKQRKTRGWVNIPYIS